VVDASSWTWARGENIHAFEQIGVENGDARTGSDRTGPDRTGQPQLGVE
jgi:hypothetical protein